MNLSDHAPGTEKRERDLAKSFSRGIGAGRDLTGRGRRWCLLSDPDRGTGGNRSESGPQHEERDDSNHAGRPSLWERPRAA